MPGKVSNAVTLAASLGATAGARKLANMTWKLGSGKQPPTDPTDPNIAIREVILWSVISGAVMGLARTLVYRRLALNARKQRSLAQGTRPK